MKVSHANGSEINTVCILLASEFFKDPVLNVAFSETNAKRRLEALHCFFLAYVTLAINYGGVLMAENESGVLVYFRPEIMDLTDEENQLIDHQLRLGCGQDYASVARLMKGLNDYHPDTPRHYYAFAVAVKHSLRGGAVVKGLFSELNMILDKANAPCYAECTRFSTRTLMRQWGYRDAGFSLQIDGFPELFPVWREAQSAT